jgi:hypothetical protein
MNVAETFNLMVKHQNKVEVLNEQLRLEMIKILGESAFLTRQAGDGWCVAYEVYRSGLGLCSANAVTSPSALAHILTLQPEAALQYLERHSI